MLIEQLTKVIKDSRKKVEKLFASAKQLSCIETVNKNSDNCMFFADCVDTLIYMISQNIKVDLIYMDPPYNSNSDYIAKIPIINGKKIEILEQIAYKDKQPTIDYLKSIILPLLLMNKVLSDKGSIYVHLDSHVVHYVKVILDEIFGEENFINEIIWQRTGAQNNATAFGNNFDVILFYGKKNRIWNTLKTEYSFKEIQSYYKVDENGNFYRLNNPTGKGYIAQYRDFGKGEILPPAGRHWSISQEEINKLIAEKKIVFTKKGYPFIKKYLNELKGKKIQSIWTDCIPPRKGSELTGYPTQKPEKLIERIIKASSNPDSIIADFYSGSGTTAAVADKLKRKWIVCDVNPKAVSIAKERLIAQNSDFKIYSCNSYKSIIDFNISIDNSKKGITYYSISELNYKTLPKDFNKINSSKFQTIYNSQPLNFIYAIELDENYNGQTFKACIRKKITEKDSEKNISTRKNSKNKIAIKITDVFGNYSIKTV